jgi:GWxTD domain-containing protein
VFDIVKQAVQFALALTAITAVAAGQSQHEAKVSVSVVRAYRPVDGQTVVDVFCRVPLLLVNPIGTSGGGAFRFAVSVRDSSGLELVSRSSWTRRASIVEHAAFTLRPGRYVVHVMVTDSATGLVVRATASVDAFSHAPGASDLLLATDIRAAADQRDTVARPGELRRGPMFLVTSGEPVLTPQASKLVYYVGLYAARAESVIVSSRVLTESGIQVVEIAPAPVAIGAEGTFAEGVVDLGGLPPGRYRFELMATGPDSQLTRSAPFGMTGFATVAGAAAVVEAGEWPTDLAESQLDETYQPLIYLMSSDEQGVYSSLSVEGKRAWLRQFWARRDPSPGTGRNEGRERFYAAITAANRRYREGGTSAIPGWSTDRGRIFIKYGAPDEVYQRKGQQGREPYEIWKYTRTRSLRYVFMDLTQFGNYTLIFTNDVREKSRPDWQDLLGPDGLKDLEENN